MTHPAPQPDRRTRNRLRNDEENRTRDQRQIEGEGKRHHDERRGNSPDRPQRHERDSERGSRRQALKSRRLRLPLDEPPQRVAQRGRGHEASQSFKCGHCHRFIGPLPSGGHHRNHCPFCLYSRHVDDHRSGDRASACGSLMAPIGAFQRPNGEHVIVHRCLGCGFERFNRIAADDDFDLVLSLPVLPPRSARRDDSEDVTPNHKNLLQ